MGATEIASYIGCDEPVRERAKDRLQELVIEYAGIGGNLHSGRTSLDPLPRARALDGLTNRGLEVIEVARCVLISLEIGDGAGARGGDVTRMTRPKVDDGGGCFRSRAVKPNMDRS